MSQQALKFEHHTIDSDPPGSGHDITLLADLTGNGLLDVIIGGKSGDVNLFWYENPGWTRHGMASAPNLEAGGVLVDLTGNGKPDIVAGQQMRGNELYWFEQPDDPRQPWPKRVIENRFEKYHDQAVGDVDGDGRPDIVGKPYNEVKIDLVQDTRLGEFPVLIGAVGGFIAAIVAVGCAIVLGKTWRVGALFLAFAGAGMGVGFLLFALVKAFTMPVAASDKQKLAGEEGELGDELAAVLGGEAEDEEGEEGDEE